jgi:hypothetical protein
VIIPQAAIVEGKKNGRLSRRRFGCPLGDAERSASVPFPNFFQLSRWIPSDGRLLFARPFHSAGTPFFPPLRVGESAIVIAYAELETTAWADLVGAATDAGARRFFEVRVTADRALVIHLISTS